MDTGDTLKEGEGMIQHIIPVYFLRDGIQARIETVQGDSGREFVFNAEDITLTNDMLSLIHISEPTRH